MKKSTKILCIVGACVLTLALAASLALNAVAYSRMNETVGALDAVRGDVAAVHDDLTALGDEVSELNSRDEDIAQEDDVGIMGNEYTIRSTKAISDAYLSGDRSALSDKEKETLDMASAVLEEIITDDMTEYDKEKAVYDWMTHNLQNDSGLLTVIPRTQADCDNPYGVLKYHNAVCVGYATTFRLFMHMMEIPCMVVHNSERYHSWDLVQLNGNWYHTDIYSDAHSGNYSHFNRTDTMQGQDQEWNRDFFPAANSYEFCYACRNAVDESDIYHVPAALREALDAHESLLSLHFDESLTEVDAQIVQQMLSDIQNRLDYNTETFGDLYMSWNWVPMDGDGYVLSVNTTWYNEDDEPADVELPEDAPEKMQSAVDEAFGDVGEGYGDMHYYEDSWAEEELGPDTSTAVEEVG